MPRNIDISTLGNLGPGRVPKGAVEDISLKNPERDTLPLSAHVNDPSRSHMASTIGIVDAGGYYASDEVEGALQEIGGASSGGRQNGVVTGFGYAVASLTVIFATPSTALIPTLRDFSGQSLTLPDNTPSVWVYLSPSVGLTQISAANPPTITSPENVLLWNFSTLGGVITSAKDARLYVRNIDQKLPFTVRSQGPQGNSESEACFVTLDAAMTYLQFSSPLGSNRSEVIIRGPVTTGPIVIPINGVHFRGEDGASITLTSGSTLFDISGSAGVTFADILLRTNVALGTAITDSVGSSTLTVTRCKITNGAFSWSNGISLPNPTGNLTVIDSTVTTDILGISVLVPSAVFITNSEVSASSFNLGSVGITVGSPPTGIGEKPSSVLSCRVSGFDRGIYVSGYGHTVFGCTVVPGTGGGTPGAGIGVYTEDSKDITISSNLIDCSTDGGITGIFATGSGSKVIGLKVVENIIRASTLYGIQFNGFVQESLIKGNQIDCNLVGFPADPKARAGVYFQPGAGLSETPLYNSVSGNTIWRCAMGMFFEGTPTKVISEIVVSDNIIHHCAVGVAGSPATFYESSTGMAFLWCASITVSGNNLYGIGKILTDIGTEVFPVPANVYSYGIRFLDCTQTIVSENLINTLFVKGAGKSVTIFSSYTGNTAFSAEGLVIRDNNIQGVSGEGIYVTNEAGSLNNVQILNPLFSGNSISNAGVGIFVAADNRGLVSNLQISGNTILNTTSGSGIEVATVGGLFPGSLSGALISENTISSTAISGISVVGDDVCYIRDVTLDKNYISNSTNDGIAIKAGTPGSPTGISLLEYISITDNDIRMSGGVGTNAINWSLVGSSFKGFRIEGNSISNAYDGFYFTAAGPGFPVTSTTITDMRFVGNSITAARYGFRSATQGFHNRYTTENNTILAGSQACLIYAASTAAVATACRGVSLSQNTFRVTDPLGVNTTISITNMKADNFYVCGNTFVGCAASGSGALYVVGIGTASGTDPSVRGLRIDGNTFQNIEAAGISLYLPGPTDPVQDVSISGNTFSDTSRDVALTRGSVIQGSFSAQIRNMAVRNNQFSGFGHSSATNGGIDLSFSSVEGLDISGNQYNSLPGAGPSYGNLISLSQTGTPGVFSGVSVSNNKSRNVVVPPSAALPALVAIDVRSFSQSVGVIISDNDLFREANASGNTVGVRFWADSAVRKLVCERNFVGGADLAIPIAGVALSFTLDGLDSSSVSHNIIEGTASIGVQGQGISVYSVSAIDTLRVSNNTVYGETGTSGKGLQVESGGGIFGSSIEGNYVKNYEINLAISGSNFVNLNASNNTCAEHSDTGIEILGSSLTSQSLKALFVNENKVFTSNDTQSYFIRIDGSGLGTAQNNIEDLSVANNSLRYSGNTANYTAGHALFLQTGKTPVSAVGFRDISRALVSQNRIFEIYHGIEIVSGLATEIQIDQNQLSGVREGIKHTLNQEGVKRFSISKNQITVQEAVFPDTGTFPLISVVYAQDQQPFKNALICDNSLSGKYVTPGVYGSYGIRVGDNTNNPEVSESQVCRNSITSVSYGVLVTAHSASSLAISQNNLSEIEGGGVEFSTGSSPGDVVDLTLSGNTVTGWSSSSSLSYFSAFSVTVENNSNRTSNLNLSNNSARNGDEYSIGYYLDLQSEYVFGVVFSGNLCSYAEAGPSNTYALRIRTNSSTANSLKNFSFMGNVFRKSDSGITYTALGGTTPDFCTFLGNIGDITAPGASPYTGTWYQFENLGGAGWTNVLPPPGTSDGEFQKLNIDNGT